MGAYGIFGEDRGGENELRCVKGSEAGEETFRAAQRKAATPIPPVTPNVVIQPPSKSGGANCDPAYPTVCIPSPPPDLDCGDIPQFKNFKVLPPDPHRFDGNHDGVGCEE
jgi:hypothetical protein